MSLRTARILTSIYLALALFFVTWPGLKPFAGRTTRSWATFSMAWIAGWIAGAFLSFRGLTELSADTVMERTPNETVGCRLNHHGAYLG
ncbi:MAG: hypothetical protein CM1200mP14_17920 [Gammaproteobacteria bacterium]|nr:MAG: hypothetical protein CM1200mP14_17920 [Gammaproteobacteria bacterium]